MAVQGVSKLRQPLHPGRTQPKNPQPSWNSLIFDTIRINSYMGYVLRSSYVWLDRGPL